jgi:uncharacterized phage infection (PIP) family protein YhgE
MVVENNEIKRPLSTGRRVWIFAAIGISLLVLLLSVAGIAGTWVVRAVALDVTTGVLDGVDQVAGVGREGVAQLGGDAADLRATVSEVESAVDQIAQNVTDKGLVLTLLPPETEQELDATAERIGESLDDIRSLIRAAVDLIDAVSSLPFVNVPEPDPEEVQALENDVNAIGDAVDQLAADIQAFRDGVATEIAAVSAAVSEVNGWLEKIQQGLGEIDGGLSRVQERANQIAGRLRLWATVIAVLLSMIQAWVSYALVTLIRAYWAELRGQEHSKRVS